MKYYRERLKYHREKFGESLKQEQSDVPKAAVRLLHLLSEYDDRIGGIPAPLQDAAEQLQFALERQGVRVF